MLILSYTFLLARNHCHPTGIAKLFSTSWSKIPLFLSPAVWVSGHLLKADPAFSISSCNSPRNCIPHNFEILPERNVTVEDSCTVINFFYRKGQEAQVPACIYPHMYREVTDRYWFLKCFYVTFLSYQDNSASNILNCQTLAKDLSKFHCFNMESRSRYVLFLCSSSHNCRS